jgi:hypothetical protein
MLRYPFLTAALSLSLFAQVEPVITGLSAPQRVIMTASGNFLVTETSTAVDSGRVSYVTRSGARRSLLEGMPSGTDVTGGGSGPTAMALRDRTLYVAIGGGDAERAGAQPGTSQLNPKGMSSTVFASVLRFTFSQDIDAVSEAFRPTQAQFQSVADGNEVEISNGAGGTARVMLLARTVLSQPDPISIYRFSNPWGLALSNDGGTLWMVDASADALYSINTATGRIRKVMRFPKTVNQTPIGPPMVDAVPTSVRVYGDQLLVSFLTGFPFASGAARVLLVDPQAGTADPFIVGLTSATDVYTRNGRFYVLEFSQNQIATPPGAGLLVRYDSPAPTVVTDQLQAAVSMVEDPSTGEIFVLELTGRLMRVR